MKPIYWAEIAMSLILLVLLAMTNSDQQDAEAAEAHRIETIAAMQRASDDRYAEMTVEFNKMLYPLAQATP